MKKIDKFVCSICEIEYSDIHEAERCERQRIEKAILNVGDIVYVMAGYSWFDGDKRWVMNPMKKIKVNPKHGNCFNKCCTMAFYYVVTEIDQDPNELHRIRYHLYTKAMAGKKGHVSGYTRIGTHVTPKLIKNPPKFIVEDSKKLIGRKSELLI